MTTKKEYQARRAVWIADLRSGKFKQTQLLLHTRDKHRHHKYCCLGVAMDKLSALDLTIEIIPSDGIDYYTYLGKEEALPNIVQEYYGLIGQDGEFVYIKGKCVTVIDGKLVLVDYDWDSDDDEQVLVTSLVDANDDQRISFAEIANFIEKYPELLFKEGTY